MLNHEKYLERFNEKWKGEYELLGTYVKGYVPILLRHNKCSKEYEKLPYEALRYGCKECARTILNSNLLDGGKTKTQEQFALDLKAKFDDEYILAGEYEHYKKKVKLKHSLCNHEFYIRPTDILHDNRGCTYCSQSDMAKRVEDWLLVNRINYTKEYSFNDCIYVRKLKFDFAVFENRELKALIECDGEQHLKPVKFFGGQDYLRETQARDDIKNKYCTDNNIKLIRISHTVKDIELCLMKSLALAEAI